MAEIGRRRRGREGYGGCGEREEGNMNKRPVRPSVSRAKGLFSLKLPLPPSAPPQTNALDLTSPAGKQQWRAGTRSANMAY